AFDLYAIGWSYSSSTHGSACGSAPRPATIDRVFHFLLVTVNGSQVTVTPTDELGRTFDVQTFNLGGGTSDITPPSAPVLSLGTVTGHQVNLSWTKPNDNVGVTGYKVYRNGNATPITTINSGDTLSYADTGLGDAQTYTYTV